MYLPVQLGCTLVMADGRERNQDPERGAMVGNAEGCRVLPGTVARSHPPEVHREPDHPRLRQGDHWHTCIPDHPAVDVWARREQGHEPLVGRPTPTHGHEDRRWPRPTDLEVVSVTGSVETPI